MTGEYPMGCLFCNIINGTTPSKKVFENDKVYAFEDINPQAPVHILVVHKTHIEKIDDLDPGSSSTMSDIFLAVKEIAILKGIDKKGYRVIINNGPAGGQVIWHIHVHVLGGRDSMGPMLSR
jgi:histidine triad (HIT) family protein